MTKKIVPVPEFVKQDLTGHCFGRWTVLGYAGKVADRQGWLCRCDCGNERAIQARYLLSGESQGCGCHRRHHLVNTPEYRAYHDIKTRCYNRRCASYPDYGGRGIKLCDRWLMSFENFYNDMGRRPGPAYSIDRIDNDGDYEPKNCRWATPVEQSNNRRRTRFLTCNGETLSVKEWAGKTGIPYNTLAARIYTRGMAVEDALTTPIQRRGQRRK